MAIELSSFMPAAIACVLTASICALVVLAVQRTGLRLTRTGDLLAVQAAHSAPTPRVGGVAVMLAFGVVGALAFETGHTLWFWMVLSALPLFVSGVAEDLGFRVKPIGRLGAALLSASLMVLTTGAWVHGTGVPGLDWILSWTILAVPATVITSAGMAHAFNLIDGLNGLAGGTAVIAATGIAVTAYSVGDPEVLSIALLLGASVLGFLVVNFPRGRIFFGDSGAYTVGLLLISLAVVLSSRHDDVAPMAMMLMLFWPLADMLLAIWRRHHRRVPVSHPDRLHFHQLVMRALEIEIFSRTRRHITNPLATLVLLPGIVAPVVAGVLLHDRHLAAAGTFVLFLTLFFATYALGMQYTTRRTRKARHQCR